MLRTCLLRALFVLVVATLLSASGADARNPIRNAFFNTYPNANNTQLDDLPSNANHCGVCHFDFDGSGQRNPYGLGVEIGRNSGLTDEQAILAIENTDSDADGYTNLVEITSTFFGNTPTFPGLSQSNKNNTVNIPVSEIEPYLTPSSGSDTTPPTVTVLSPNGGNNLPAAGFASVTYTATDASGISHVNFYLSDDGGASWMRVGRNEAPTGTYAWFVPNRPGGQNRIRVEAYDNAGNPGEDESDADFTITGVPAGFVPSTLRDMDLPGTQPFEGAILDDPAGCGTCHGGYDTDVEPWHGWFGSMMGQAMRDPLFLACVAVAEQDAPSVGDLCIRCHSPGGWQEGRSTDTGGGLLNEKDFHGVQCDFCHRAVDHDYVMGVSPPEDTLVLETVFPLPLHYGNGQFINDPAPYRRGPYADAEANHQFLASPFHRSSDLCGLCHDVSNPVFVKTGPFDYAPNGFDAGHPDMDLRNMMPVERTYSEWTMSEYASTGVYAPQFAGNKPDGIVSTCQDCHMRDVVGAGCGEPGSPTRDDLGLHDLMGGNTFIPDVLPGMWPGEVDSLVLQDAKQRAIDMLQLAATLEAAPAEYGVLVRVTNETAHKLPSGYPEGRRIWLYVEAVDGAGQTVFESGRYDFATGELTHDDQAKIYEIHPGLSPGLAAALGLPAGPSFHFVLNDTVYEDSRIPPRGFTNAGFEAIQSPPVGHAYADGQYWDDTPYNLPASAETVHVTLYYQTTTKEYVEFLRDENVTNSAGDDLYNAWVAHGKSTPIVMA
ncbi:MAG: Ig-like domain-containing protein, partial [Candidatus Eisenbacteria bacterium]